MALPPTASKFSTDVNNVTTFFFDFPNFTGSHSGVTATLGINSVAGGGTGLATLTLNNVILGNGTSTPLFVAPGISGNVLTSNGTTWISSAAAGFANPMTTAGDIIFENATPAPDRLPIGMAGQVLTVSGGFPAWGTFTPSFTGLTPNAPVISLTSSTITTTTVGAQGQVFTSNGGVTPPSWSTLSGNAAFDSFASSQITTQAIVSATSFTTFSNSPAFTITPTISGTYKIYSYIAAQNDTGGGGGGTYRIFNTSGGASLLQESQAQVSSANAGGGITDTAAVQSIYTLTAGSTYVFDIQGMTNGTGSIYTRGDEAPFYMFAEGINLALDPISLRYFSSSTIISGSLSTIVYATQDYDTNSAYSGGVFTAPQSGKYQVNASLLITGTISLNNTLIMEIQKNGSVISRKTVYLPAALTDGSIQINDIINLALSDTIRIQVSTSAVVPTIVSSNFDNYLSISQLR